jgi:hypothetical protein
MSITPFQACAFPLRFLPLFFMLLHLNQDYDDAEHHPC